MLLALAAATGSAASAADLAVRPAVRAAVHHHRLSVVRDYDGTPVVMRRRADGAIDAVFAPRATPRYYLNGEPVSARYAIR
jgi:hypothetical protein